MATVDFAVDAVMNTVRVRIQPRTEAGAVLEMVEGVVEQVQALGRAASEGTLDASLAQHIDRDLRSVWYLHTVEDAIEAVMIVLRAYIQRGVLIYERPMPVGMVLEIVEGVVEQVRTLGRAASEGTLHAHLEQDIEQYLCGNAKWDTDMLLTETTDPHERSLLYEEYRGAAVLLASLADWNADRCRKAALRLGPTDSVPLRLLLDAASVIDERGQ